MIPSPLLPAARAAACASAHAVLLLALLPAAPAVRALELLPGFEATVFVPAPGATRHLAVGDGGWVFAALARPHDGRGLLAARDEDGDGVADDVRYFGPGLTGSGLALHDGRLYYGKDDEIVRFDLGPDGLPRGRPVSVVAGFPQQRSHAVKAITLDDQGHLYVNVGAPSNACQAQARTRGSPGLDPCPQLERHGAIWRFLADGTGQDQMEDGMRYSTGHRNAMAIDWHDGLGTLFLAQHGRDQLHTLFPELYTEAMSSELPAEEFHRVALGDDLGWPYSYYDPRKGTRVRMPEYGGGPDRAVEGKTPLLGFPGHWAPNDLILLDEDSAPGRGALIAFHGSWNRAEVQQGYRVVFVPLTTDGEVAGPWSTFADGFAGAGPVRTSGDAEHRPTGLAEGPDGAIYVSSAVHGGRIWRIVRTGADAPAPATAATTAPAAAAAP
jgi:glucose/arabinose dehydrogenase